MKQDIQVWNLFIRLFHWVLVIAFTVSYISGENEEFTIHHYSGYLITTLIVARIIWGCIDRGHGRFSHFVYGRKHLLDYSSKLISGKAPRYIGHNPLGGLMVIAMLTLLLLTVVSGMMLLGIDEYEGPLYFLGDLSFANELASVTGEIHELSSTLMLPAIALHVLGVLFSSFYHRENLVWSMVNGKKRTKNH